MNSTSLMRHLIGHFVRPTEMFPGGFVVTEVGENGVQGAQRVDAVHVGLTSSSGRILQGFELKTSLADFRREFAGGGSKADRWADATHAFWLVTNGTDVINPDETPPGWGYMCPDPRRPTKMRIVLPPVVKQDFNPPWWCVRSILARQDTMRAAAVADLVRRTVEGKVKGAIELHERQRSASGTGVNLTPEQSADLQVMAAFRANGITLLTWRDHDDAIRPEDLKDPAIRQLIRDHHTADSLRAQLTDRWAALPGAARTMTELVAVVAKLNQPPAAR